MTEQNNLNSDSKYLEEDNEVDLRHFINTKQILYFKNFNFIFVLVINMVLLREKYGQENLT